eukprot:s3131_g3.t1
MSYPMENGEIENFEDIEKLWTYIFEEKLKIESDRCPVLLTEPPYNPTGKREKMVMFETFGVPSLNISIQGVLALLGQGRTTGLVLDSGEGVTHCVPIFDGYGLPHCINRLDLAGRDLNTLLCKLIALEGKARLTTTEQHAAARQMKESPNARRPQTNTLRDLRGGALLRRTGPIHGGGRVRRLSIAGRPDGTAPGRALEMSRSAVQPEPCGPRVLWRERHGERLSKELRALAPVAAQCDIRVLKSRDQISAVWTGGQVFASLREMQEELWMSIDDYDEYGASLMHEKVAVKFN